MEFGQALLGAGNCHDDLAWRRCAQQCAPAQRAANYLERIPAITISLGSGERSNALQVFGCPLSWCAFVWHSHRESNHFGRLNIWPSALNGNSRLTAQLSNSHGLFLSCRSTVAICSSAAMSWCAG